ncbi:MAG TPA: glycosyltransferase 87 family protein [Solirubrobacteraceae bacterium]|nr:glycosyltransferase 87 family protein [Solirubrobacteraceae bacterium]
MRRIARENAPWALAALAGCASLAWLGLKSFAWSDYESESRPAFEALVHGHLTDFLRLVPAYGGSLVERGPFALLPGLWGGGALAVYRAVAVPCLLASALLGIHLVARMHGEGRPLFARALALAVCVANPLTLRALELGHPEELLGACLCIAAVLLAAKERPLWAGLALGLAVANKEWALLAAGPVLLALPPRRRPALIGSSLAAAALVLAPLLLIGSGGFSSALRASAAPPAVLFHPWQVFWFLGHHAPASPGAGAALAHGYRVGPSWTGTVSHPLILATGLVLPIALWLRARRPRCIGLRAALLMLALLMLLRCLLDTWDIAYYPLPFVLALLAWEVRGAIARPPVLSASATVLAYLSFIWLPNHVSADLQAAFFLAWSLPLALALGARLLGSPLARPQAAGSAPSERRAGAQEMTVSAFSRPLRTS